MKTLRQEGVPFGARMVFRLQHAWFLLMALALLLTVPFVAVWAVVHESGQEFLEGASDVLQSRGERVRQQRDKLVRLYAGPAA